MGWGGSNKRRGTKYLMHLVLVFGAMGFFKYLILPVVSSDRRNLPKYSRVSTKSNQQLRSTHVRATHTTCQAGDDSLKFSIGQWYNPNAFNLKSCVHSRPTDILQAVFDRKRCPILSLNPVVSRYTARQFSFLPFLVSFFVMI